MNSQIANFLKIKLVKNTKIPIEGGWRTNPAKQYKKSKYY